VYRQFPPPCASTSPTSIRRGARSAIPAARPMAAAPRAGGGRADRGLDRGHSRERLAAMGLPGQARLYAYSRYAGAPGGDGDEGVWHLLQYGGASRKRVRLRPARNSAGPNCKDLMGGEVAPSGLSQCRSRLGTGHANSVRLENPGQWTNAGELRIGRSAHPAPGSDPSPSDPSKITRLTKGSISNVVALPLGATIRWRPKSIVIFDPIFSSSSSLRRATSSRPSSMVNSPYFVGYRGEKRAEAFGHDRPDPGVEMENTAPARPEPQA